MNNNTSPDIKAKMLKARLAELSKDTAAVEHINKFIASVARNGVKTIHINKKLVETFTLLNKVHPYLFSLQKSFEHTKLVLSDNITWANVSDHLNQFGFSIQDGSEKHNSPSTPAPDPKTYSSRIEAAAHTNNEKLGRPPTMDLVTFRLLGNIKDAQPIGMAYTANFDLIPSKLSSHEKTAYIIVENLAVLMHLTNKDLRFITDKYPQVVAIYANGLISKTCGAHAPKVTEWLANLDKTKNTVFTYFDFDFAGIDLAEKFSTAVNSGIIVPKWALTQSRDDSELTRLKELSKQDAYQRQVKPLLENNLQKFDADSIFGEMRRVLFVHKLAVMQEHMMAHEIELSYDADY